jgi:hypothetical protein
MRARPVSVVSRHFTRRGALRRAEKKRQVLVAQSGRSSGWKRLDYGVSQQVDSGLRSWVVTERSV